MLDPLIKPGSSSTFADKNRLEQDGVKVQTADEVGRLTQEDFFQIMTKQLSQQDPLNPTDNEAMMAQMTNMSIAEGVTNMSKKFDDFAASMTSNQALQASTLVGRNVLVGTHYASKEENEPVTGRVVLEKATTDLKIRIEDHRGVVVGEVEMGNHKSGEVDFKWDGKDTQGNVVPAGVYKFRAVGQEIGAKDGAHTELPVQTRSRVDSVSLGQNGTGLIINFNGLGSVKFQDVLEVS